MWPDEARKRGGLKSAKILKEKKQKNIICYNKNPKRCKTCSKEISYEKRENSFCSRSCGAKSGNKKRELAGWKHSKKVLEKLKESGKQYGGLSWVGKPNKVKLLKECKLCKTQFLVSPSSKNRKYCSTQCTTRDPEKYKNCGGYRKGSGNSKTGYYKGIYCGSTYELCWVIWALDNGIKFSRFKGVLSSNDVKYVPDFLLEDGKTIIELKGYESQDKVSRKTALAESLGYNVRVLRKKDLVDVFDYVKQKYNTDKFEILYDVKVF